MQTLTAKITPRLMNELDLLIENGWYASRSEAIRDAIRKLVDARKHAMTRKAIEEDLEWGLRGE